MDDCEKIMVSINNRQKYLATKMAQYVQRLCEAVEIPSVSALLEHRKDVRIRLFYSLINLTFPANNRIHVFKRKK